MNFVFEGNHYDSETRKKIYKRNVQPLNDTRLIEQKKEDHSFSEE